MSNLIRGTILTACSVLCVSGADKKTSYNVHAYRDGAKIDTYNLAITKSFSSDAAIINDVSTLIREIAFCKHEEYKNTIERLENGDIKLITEHQPLQVHCLEGNFEGKNRYYSPISVYKSELDDKHKIINVIKNNRIMQLRDQLREEGATVITDKQIGDCNVALFCVETANHKRIADWESFSFFENGIRTGTHQLRAVIQRKEGGGDGVYCPTRVVTSYDLSKQ